MYGAVGHIKERFTPYYRVPLGTMYVGATPISTFYTPQSSALKYRDAQRTWSIGHAGPPYRSGGPFWTYDYRHRGNDPVKYGTYIAKRYKLYKYVGSFISSIEPGDFSGLVPTTMGSGSWVSFGDPSPYGPAAWAKFAPGRPQVQLGVALGELRDLPRMLATTAKGFHDAWKDLRRVMNFREASNHWLNHQFGWLPFLADVRRMLHTYRNLDRLYAEAVRNNGQWTRYGGTVLVEDTSSVTSSSDTMSAHFPTLNSYFYDSSSTGSHSIIVHDTTRVWFEGKFRYWIANIDSIFTNRNFERRLFGLSLTPSLVWELIPWSWLADWFSNIGDVFAAVDNGWADNLAAKYAYVMCRKERVVELTSTNLVVGRDTWTYSVTTKKRSEASPLGFTLSWPDFTPRQIAILAALGITRSSS